MNRVETCECPSPAHCLGASGGEQGLSAEDLETIAWRNRARDLHAALATAVRALEAAPLNTLGRAEALAVARAALGAP